MMTQITQDKLTINKIALIGAFLFIIGDALSFILRSNGAEISIVNNVYFFTTRLGLILFIVNIKRTISLVLIRSYLILSFIIYGIDEIFNCLIKSTWAMYILIGSLIFSLCYLLFRK